MDSAHVDHIEFLEDDFLPTLLDQLLLVQLPLGFLLYITIIIVIFLSLGFVYGNSVVDLTDDLVWPNPILSDIELDLELL